MICENSLFLGDCLEILRGMPDDSVDLVFTSPPYEAARTYGVGFALRGQAWVDWSVERYLECLRVCRGLVAWVVEGQTRQFRWSATPALLMADLHRRGVHLRKPPIYERDGIPGSGGPDWWKNRYELIVCATRRGGRLPWSDPTAHGTAWKYQSGGGYTHRMVDGSRVSRPRKPGVANPGNIIDCGAGGGGNIGSKLAHENEAPFPEALAERFIRSFCPPGGIVLDPFCGSGTTLAVAERWGRKWCGIDCRENQIELSRRRVAEVIASAPKSG